MGNRVGDDDGICPNCFACPNGTSEYVVDLTTGADFIIKLEAVCGGCGVAEMTLVGNGANVVSRAGGAAPAISAAPPAVWAALLVW